MKKGGGGPRSRPSAAAPATVAPAAAIPAAAPAPAAPATASGVAGAISVGGDVAAPAVVTAVVKKGEGGHIVGPLPLLLPWPLLAWLVCVCPVLDFCVWNL